jgi:hypothetical protein
MSALGRLVVSLTAETAQFHQALDKAGYQAQRSFSQISNAAKTAATAIGIGFGGIQIGNVFQAIVREAEQAQTNLLRTQALLDATGNTVGKSAELLVQQAQNLSAGTLQSTEDVQRAQQVLLSYTNIVGKNFDRTLSIAADLASLMGTSLPSAVETFAKALDAPIERVSSLTRIGFNFTEQQKEQIKTLVESNKLFEAQKIILDVAAASFGGLARRETEGYAGAQKELAESVKNAVEQIEKQFAVLDKSTSVVKGLASSVTGLTNLIIENKTAIGIWLGVLGGAGLIALLPKITAVMYAFAGAVAATTVAFAANPVAFAILAITAAAIPAVNEINKLVNAKQNLAKATTEADKEMNAFVARNQQLMAVIKQRQAGAKAEKKENEDVKKITEGLVKEYYSLFLTRSQLVGLDLASKGATQKQIEDARSIVTVITEEVEARKKLEKTQTEAKTLFEQTRTPAEKLNIEYAKLNDLLSKGAISWDVYSRATLNAQEAFDAATKSSEEFSNVISGGSETVSTQITLLEDYANRARDLSSSLDYAAASGLRNLEDKIIDVKKGTITLKDAFRSMASSIIEDLIRIQIRQSITGPLSSFLGSVIGGFTGTQSAAPITTYDLSGVRAMGGPVSRGSSYLVGERGPEIFTPYATGSITANSDIQGGQPPEINIKNINVLDPAIVGNYLSTSAGERIILNIIQRNRGALA